MTLEDLRKAAAALAAKRIVFSDLIPAGKKIGMKEGRGFDLPRMTLAHEEPDYYVIRREDYEQAEYLSLCERHGVKP